MAFIYKRILLKLSGESLMGTQQFGIDPTMLRYYADQIHSLSSEGVQIAVVIGGGNIFRGLDDHNSGVERVQGDYMGMLATCINGMALQSALESKGVYTRLISAIEMRQIAEPYIRRRCIRHLEKNRVVIFSAGTGNPYFTTDSAASLRASEIGAEVILKGTRVNGIYSADPEKNKDAILYDKLSFDDVIRKNLKVMDMTAFTMCQENNMPIVVFDVNQPDNLLRLMKGEKIGTLVSN
ncbi:MAG: UMP kinase [Saprospiraceae bacterium]|jgi:uridylate kinase|nr:UMP kinase [Saprospiraceae bacterium]MBK7795873.1 UMP kinase [Saprospiraceae bacterium]MBK9379329.1 UMP kinase [Saprospiraceae bacterium]MBL0260984.1 UMP kinase [Saprospiraceae bacterium]MBX7163255.1 UMP kinase [Saprospiraceae bacterium]